MRKAFLAIPSLSGKCLPATDTTVGFFEMEAECLGWGFQKLIWGQDSLIAHARNVCVAKFLESDATDLFFLDSDVASGPGAFTRLMSHQADFVAAVYRVKSDEEKYPVRGCVERKEQNAQGLLEVNDVPFGFVRITRTVIEKMVAVDSEDWFWANHKDKFKCHRLFDTEIRDHQFWGEDFYFCRKYRELGGQIFIDPDIKLAHIGFDQEGNPKAYSGSFSSFLRKQ